MSEDLTKRGVEGVGNERENKKQKAPDDETANKVLEWNHENDSSSVTLRASGFSVCVHFFGATVTSWEHAGREQLFVSTKSKFNQVNAIRGGIPVVFPQFGRPNEAMSQHGFARTSIWTLGSVSSSLEDNACSVELLLSSSESTLAQWPFEFQLKYTVTVGSAGLRCTLCAVNTGSAAFDCHTLLHTYIRVPHITEVRVAGFQGLSYIDKVSGGAISTTADELIEITSEVDSVYQAPPAQSSAIPNIEIISARSNRSIMRIEKAAFLESAGGSREVVEADCVLWNGWTDKCKALSDMDDDAWEHYVCVEPGTVSRYISVAPQTSLTLTQNLVPN